VNPSDDDQRVFIVRAWQEPREIEGAPSEWRGMIVYVPDGTRRYWNELEQVTNFIAAYLMNAPPPPLPDQDPNSSPGSPNASSDDTPSSQTASE
jgi:hypothetical protein